MFCRPLGFAKMTLCHYCSAKAPMDKEEAMEVPCALFMGNNVLILHKY